jgi:ABC-type phosphate transport system substrate-binding protein
LLAAVAVLSLGVAACGDDDDDSGNGGSSDTSGQASDLSGSIRIDGSSTVGPLTEAVVERFNEENPDVDISVGQAGTGGGFEKFCAGETDINDASRPIESDEVQLCNKAGVKQEEVVVANDNQTVVGVQGSEGGIGYFGYSYFQENQEGLKAAEVENDKGECVAPSEETVQAGDYTPLGRELFIYPSQEALAKPEVKAFVDYYLANVNDIASEVGFIGLTPEQLSKSEAAVQKLG